MVLFVWWTALIVAFGGVLTGYHNSSLSGILEMRGFQTTFSHLFNTSSQENNVSGLNNDTLLTCSSDGDSDFIIGFIVSIGNLGSAVGSLLIGRFSDIYSRKYGLAISGLVLAVGSTLVASSYHLWSLLLGRAINGVTIGMLYILMPVYVSEMSPKAKRGLTLSLMGPGFSIGLFLGFCLNIGFSRLTVGWRVSSAVLGLGGLVYAFAILWLSHTPRWLAMKHRDDEALLVLTKINYNTEADTCVELKDLRHAANTSSSNNRTVFSEFFKWKYFSRFLLMNFLFFLCSVLLTLPSFYPVTFFCEVGVMPFTTSIILGPIIILASIIAVALIDKIGRKLPLICTSAINMLLSLIAAVLLQLYPAAESELVNYIVVMLFCLYSFFIFFVWVLVPWIINSEVYPLSVKGIGASASNSVYWLLVFVFNLVIPYMLGPPINLYGFLYLMAGTNLLACFFVALAIPETKGVSLEHVDELFSQSWWKRISLGTLCSYKNESSSYSVNPLASKDIRMETYKDCDV